MIILKKALSLSMITIIVFALALNSTKNNIYSYAQVLPQNQVNVAVILFTFDDPYISLVRKSLEEIQNRNGSNVKYTFYDGKRNQSIQNEEIASALNNNYDLLLVNLVDLSENTVTSVIDEVKSKNIPIILFNTIPFNVEPIKTYSKALVISTNADQSGILQGNLVVNAWNSNKGTIDKDGDNVLQYIMLKGPANNTAVAARTFYSISTVNDAGIKTEELASINCNWDQELAKNAVEPLFLKYNNKIEAIIANNDAMAIGAIEALQKYGYNTGDKTKYVPVFGIDGIQEAKDLIDKGIMAGTVIQDPNETTEALYTVGMNLVYNRNPLENTNYKFDNTGVTIEIPYHEYIPKSSS
ncbi:galactose ABC transporter substrate-binding protein [Clostridium sp.]|uniref:galactose ABC transporter substrate-binding protein n=1 Tax=Clostridium sp. TaxID=1506 RepID=UPI002840317A|nr:galactose ABC transporter substrate-binding protein [Clostridium sp.]MDR3593781.1 galactose ABC transporter substrate-binding protein [Clostridium sp.]